MFRRLEVEAAIAKKHLEVWQMVVDRGLEGAVVFEDDVFPRSERSAREMCVLVKGNCKRFDLIDLAGGLSWTDMGLRSADLGDLELDIIAANTACAYFISAAACKGLVQIARLQPALLYFSPDFLISELNRFGFSGKTLMPAEPPFRHGSREGLVDTSIPY